MANYNIAYGSQFTAEKTYWVQIEGIPEEKTLDQLRKGINLKTA